MYGFADECRTKLKEDIQDENSIFKRFSRLFEWLPLAAVIDEKYICLHAGVGKYLKSVEQIENIQRPVEAKILAPETEND